MSDRQVGDPDFKHPKCYANTRGGCSRAISGEHYISHALLRLYTFDDPQVTIKPGPNYRSQGAVQPKKWVAKVLCAAHNSAFSPADEAALKFASFLRTIALRYRNGAGEWGSSESVTVPGDRLQQWALKCLLTHHAASVFTEAGGQRVRTVINPDAIDVLLGRATWPITWGLGVSGDTTNSHLSIDPFSQVKTVTTDWWGVTPIIKHDPRELLGGLVDLAGVTFTLGIFNQSRSLTDRREINPLRGALLRPASITWELDGVPKTVQFTWSDPYPHKTVTLTMTRRERRADLDRS